MREFVLCFVQEYHDKLGSSDYEDGHVSVACGCAVVFAQVNEVSGPDVVVMDLSDAGGYFARLALAS